MPREGDNGQPCDGNLDRTLSERPPFASRRIDKTVPFGYLFPPLSLVIPMVPDLHLGAGKSHGAISKRQEPFAFSIDGEAYGLDFRSVQIVSDCGLGMLCFRYLDRGGTVGNMPVLFRCIANPATGEPLDGCGGHRAFGI